MIDRRIFIGVLTTTLVDAPDRLGPAIDALGPSKQRRGCADQVRGVTRGLQIVHNDEERKRAIVTRRNVLKNIGDLARGPGAELYAHIKEDEDSFVLDDAPRRGTPEEVIARSKRLDAGGVEHVLFAPVPRSPVCAPSPRRSCRPSTTSRWPSPWFDQSFTAEDAKGTQRTQRRLVPAATAPGQRPD
jgi:hypothetical protein